jgi:hypothetical protein
VTTPGDPKDPRHRDWLAALGAATDTAASLATICFNVARILGGVSSDEMYRDPLGAMEGRVRAAARQMGSPPPELAGFIDALPAARETRNDLLHALRFRDGLYRRVAEPPRIREFFTVESLDEARAEMEAARRLGSRALYFDGGQSVRAWRAAGGS